MSTIQIQVSDDLKKDATQILSQLDLDLSTTIKMYLKKIIQTKSIPFQSKVELTENGFTKEQENEILRRVEDIKQGENLVGPFNSAQEFIDDLHSCIKK